MKYLLLLLPILLFNACKVKVTPQPVYYESIKASLSTMSTDWVDIFPVNDLNKSNEFERTALTYAVLQGNVSLAEKLIEKGANVDHKDRWGVTPYEYSALFTDTKVQFDFPDSIKKPIDTTRVIQAWREQSKMLDIIRNNLLAGNYKKAAEYIPFADLHAPVLGVNPPYGSFYTQFLKENRYEICEFLLKDVQLYVNAAGENGRSGFSLIDMDSTAMVELLFSANASLNSVTSYGLHLSSDLLKYEDTLLLKRFEDKGMSILPQTLERAIKKENSDLITYLSSRTTLIDSSRAKYDLAKMNDSLLLNQLFDSISYDEKLIRILTSKKQDQTLPWLLARDIDIADSILLNRCKVLLDESTVENLVNEIDDSLVLKAMNRAVNAQNMTTATALLNRVDSLPDSLKNYPAQEADNIDTSFIKLLIEKGAEINLPSKRGDYALIQALERKNNSLVKWLVKAGVDLNRTDKFGYTALTRAARYKNREIVNLLIDSGTDLSIKTKEGRSFLYELIHSDSSYYRDVVTRLWQESEKDSLVAAGVHEVDTNGITIFTEMCDEKDTAALNFYFEMTKGTDFPSKRELGIALVKASRNSDSLAFRLIERGAPIEIQDQYGNTPLHNSLTKKFDTLTKLLIEKGADLNKKNKHEVPPLFSLLWIDEYDQYRSEDLTIMNSMIEKGADLTFVNKKGEGVLSFITDQEMSMDLIKRGAPVDVVTMDSSLIVTVIKSGNLNWATAVIERSKKINSVCDQFGNSPLAFAISYNRVEIARVLIKHGAKTSHKSVQRQAKHVTNSDMNALLREYGIK